MSSQCNSTRCHQNALPNTLTSIAYSMCIMNSTKLAEYFKSGGDILWCSLFTVHRISVSLQKHKSSRYVHVHVSVDV